MSWVAFLFSLWGVYLVSKKNKWCWVVWLVGNVCWIIYAWSPFQLALIVTQVIYILTNIYGIWEWWLKPNEKTNLHS
jgi:nicotinamide riboside transporter PnuC